MSVTFERWGRNAISAAIGTLFPARTALPAYVREQLKKNPAPKILFIRPHQGLGDLLLATPIFRELKRAYPYGQIHFLADTYNEVAIRDNPRLDKIWIWDKKRMRNIFKLIGFIRALRKEKYLIALPLSSHVPSFTSFWLARLSGASYVWSFETETFYGGANWSRHLAHVELPNRPASDPEWVKFMSAVQPLIGLETSHDFTPEFAVTPAGRAEAKSQWQKITLPPGRKKIGLFFGGNPDRPERLWPAESWGDLALRIQESADLALVAIVPPPDFLSGSRALEQGVYPQVAARLATPPPVFSDRDLAKVAAFIKDLDCFVCVDGGIFHVAVAYGVTTLGLFFKTDPACWKPPVSWATVLRPADDIPTSLSPDEVYQKIRELVLKSNHVPSTS